MDRRARMVLAGVVLGLALLLVHGGPLLEHVERSNSRWCFADDARIWLYSFFRYQTPNAFAGDRIVDYMLGSMPDGYRLLYRVLGPFVGFGVLSKLLPYVLLAVILATLGFSSYRLGGLVALAGTLSLALGSAYLLGRMAGGLPRAFGLPFLACGAALLVRGSVRALGALTIVGAVFYPVLGVMLGCCFALVLCLPAPDRGDATAWSWRTRVLALALVGAGTIAACLPARVRMHEWGPAIGPAMWTAYPEAAPGGRLGGDDVPPFADLLHAVDRAVASGIIGAGEPFVEVLHRSDAPSTSATLLALVSAALWIPLARRRVEARRLLLLAASVPLCYGLALVAYPLLYVPERYVTYTTVLFALVAIPTATAWYRPKRRWRAVAVAVAWNALVLALVGGRGSDRTGLTVTVGARDQTLYRSIEALPPTVLIAGWPDEVMDCLPYLAHRSVLLSRETQQPWNTKYVEMLRERMLVLVRAYFATTNAPLLELRDRYHVTHLLLNRDYFANPPDYFKPFGDFIRATFAQARGRRFVALDAIPRAQVLAFGPYVLLDLSKL